MLLAINTINEINSFLERQNREILINHEIVLKISMEIEIYLLVTQEDIISNIISEQFHSISNNLIIHEIPDYQEDDYKHIFDTKNKVNLTSRRRLTNFIDFIDAEKENDIFNLPPITTFYSYKGGLGRSTTLASFASFCAKLKKKRVVIVDCDFEAPGFTNYYDLDPEILSKRNGIVEYLLDKLFANQNSKKLDIEADYSYKVGYEYSGEGEIFVIPAGNLSNEPADDKYEINKNIAFKTHREHYLEALSRIDISSIKNIELQILEFLNDLTETLKPDIILFDARTGFNDIFAVLACISQTIVGFFGNNLQNKIGLEQFLDTFGNINSEKNIILINSLITDLEYYDNFKSYVDKYIQENEIKFSDDNTTGILDIKKHFIKRDSVLSKIGTDFVYRKTGKSQLYDVNFVNLIEQNIFFQPVFDDIYKTVENSLTIEKTEVEEKTTISEPIKEIVHKKSTEGIIEYLQNNKGNIDKNKLTNEILTSLKNNIPVRYADYEIPKVDDFYFRECMKDMFNRSKFLITGSKGTGKTFLYQSFKNPELRKKLQERNGITSDDYLFVNIISVKDQKTQKGLDRYTEAKNFNIQKISDTDFFFERFWNVFVWNSIMLDNEIKKSKYFSDEIPVEEITKEPDTILRFKKYIENDDLYFKIYSILKNLDFKLKSDDKKLIILFDQLDFVVKPEYWPQGIAPLIEFWRANPFTSILPKIFVRSDLFKNLTNLTNVHNLYTRSIDIEWKKKELFAFFFKVVFKTSQNELLLLHYHFNNYDNIDFFETFKDEVKDKQIPLDEKILRPLVETFFGKNADWRENSSRFGESYDWFYNNLVDAIGNVSIRPFLDLIDKAIEIYQTKKEPQFIRAKQKRAILPSSFYSSFDAREYAVHKYFTDLSSEKGNLPLIKIHNFIKKEGQIRYKIPTFRRSEFIDMLKEVIKRYKNDIEIKDKTPDDLVRLLVQNGIFKEIEKTNRKYTNYVMPFLYRNYFGVSNRNMEKPNYQR